MCIRDRRWNRRGCGIKPSLKPFCRTTLQRRISKERYQSSVSYTHLDVYKRQHIFCTRNEIDGDKFLERYCMDDTISREEDGTMNAGYAVWRELIAELIAFELGKSPKDNQSMKQKIFRLFGKRWTNTSRKNSKNLLKKSDVKK